MNARLCIGAAAMALLIAASPAGAQAPAGAPPGGGRAQAAQAVRERRQAMAERMRNMTPEQRKEMRERMKTRRDSVTPAQREALKERRAHGRRPPLNAATLKARREEQKALREQVKAGTLDRHAAAEKLREWDRAHRPAAPGGGGE